MKDLTKDTAWNWATGRCAMREICRHDIWQKLCEKGLPPEDAEAVCDRLEDEKYVDDSRYARAFAHDKILFDGWGKIKVTQALRLKKIAPNVVEEALNEAVDETTYKSKLHDILVTKNRSVKEEDIYKRTEKLVRFAASRGFEANLIFETMEEVV